MLLGRLGLETARVPHADRHGLLWLSRGKLYVEDGCLRFATAGDGEMEAGDYAIAFQQVSCVLLQPGTSVTHDALRLLARHGTGLVATGVDGVRHYASMPFGPDRSELARSQVLLWSDPVARIDCARQMYAWRLGEILPTASIEVLRGIEGARMRETYARLAEQFGIGWLGRRYDRKNPQRDDVPNQAINHASTAVVAAAMVAVASTATIPQLGFIHEHSSTAFALDVADLYRDEVTLPAAFAAVRKAERRVAPLERLVRQSTGELMRKKKLIPSMIDRIKELLSQ